MNFSWRKKIHLADILNCAVSFSTHNYYFFCPLQEVLLLECIEIWRRQMPNGPDLSWNACGPASKGEEADCDNQDAPI
jgi:hypothetical protein